MSRDWVEWHEAYADPASWLAERLGVVTAMVKGYIDTARSGPLTCLSLCAGEARDLTDALAQHPRRLDVSGVVVELDPVLAGRAAARIASVELEVSVIVGDAGDTSTFAHALPVDLLLLAGVFGNTSDSDVERIVRAVPRLCRSGGAVIWTRHRHEPDLTPEIIRWFDEAACTTSAFVSPGPGRFAVGRSDVGRADATSSLPDRLFTFRDDLW